VQYQGFPPGFLAQVEAPFGGSLEEAVARLQDGSLPAADVDALRNMFSSMLELAGGDRGTVDAPIDSALNTTMDAAAAMLPSGGQVEAASEASLELPANLLAALGLPAAGQNLPDELPPDLSDGLADPLMPTNDALPIIQPAAESPVLPTDAAVAGTVDRTLFPSESADEPTASLVDESSSFAGLAPNGETLVTAAPAWLAGSSSSPGNPLPGDASVDTSSPPAGMPAGVAGSAENAVSTARGESAGPTASGLGLPADEPAQPPPTPAAAQPATPGSVSASDASAAASTAAQRLAALLAEIDALGESGEVADDALSREAMQRIDAALQAVRSGLAAPDAPAVHSPLVESLAARLIAAGDDAGKRMAALQEFRQQSASAGETAPVASPLAPNPAASLVGSERAQPSLPAASVPLQHERWADEVGERVRWMIGQQMHTAELKITPANLGTIEVRISMHNDQMQISFASPHAAVREVLEDAAPRLREMMAAAGYAGVDVDVSHQQPQRHNEGGPGHRAGMAAWGDDDPAEVEQISGTITPRISGALDCYA
jgi:flagellar hook-length control protein FliK